MPKSIVVLLNWLVTQPNVMTNRALQVKEGLLAYPLLFVTPTVLPADLMIKRDAVLSTYIHRGEGDVARGKYDDALIDLDQALRDDAAYVDGIAKGDLMIINKAGYDGTKDYMVKNTIVPEVGKPVNIEVQKGGTVILSTLPIVGADSYTFILFLGDSFDLDINGERISIPASTGPRAEVLIVPKAGLRKRLTGFAKGTILNVQALGVNAIGLGAIGPITDGISI